MAGDWIKWSKGLTKRREVLVLAAKLRISRFEVAARLMEFWEWCDENIPQTCIDHETGDATIDIGPEPFQFVDDLLGLQNFAACMASAEVQWLALRSGSRLLVPKFGHHNGTTAKERAYDQRRKQKQRSDAVNVRNETGNLSGNKPDINRTREEKRRKEKIKPSTSSQIQSGSEPHSPALPAIDPGGGGGENYVFVEEDRTTWKNLKHRLEGFGMALANDVLNEAIRHGISPEKITVLIGLWLADAIETKDTTITKWTVGMLYEKIRMLQPHQDPAALVWPPPCETWQIAQRSSPKTDRTQEATIIIREGRKKHAPDPKIAEVLQQRGYGDLIGSLLGSQFVPNPQETTF